MSLPDPPRTIAGWGMIGSLLLALGTPIIGIAFWLGQLSTSHDEVRMLAQQNATAIRELVRVSERHDSILNYLERSGSGR